MAGLPKVIYVMGPPGAGKGTQAQLLAEQIGYKRFSTGDAFREAARQSTPFGQRVKETIENGFLMPPEDAAEVVINAIRKHIEAGDGLIFDGTPRTVKEAAMVDTFFAESGYGKPLAIYLKVDREEMIRRNSQRRFCLGISGDFPVVTEEDRARCEELGGRVDVRPDDAPEKFATRWDEFMNQTFPVVERYLKEGIAQEVDGMPAPPEVHESVMGVINKLNG
jgi:adenylate kinase